MLSLTGTQRLYHIQTDPYEQDDLTQVRSDLVESFLMDAIAWAGRIRVAPQRLEALGRLVDEEGRPVRGRLLRLVGENRIRRIRTDGRGWFLFSGLRAGDYRVCGLDFSLPIGPTGAYLGTLSLPCLDPRGEPPRIGQRSTSTLQTR